MIRETIGAIASIAAVLAGVVAISSLLAGPPQHGVVAQQPAAVTVAQPAKPAPPPLRVVTSDLLLCRDLFGLICYAFH